MIYIFSFMALVLFFLFMGVGVIFSNKRLKGSCGGLGRVMGEDCSICGKKELCERERSQKG